MARLKVSATRSNLMLIKQRLKLARDGHRLLNKKRDVLVLEILRLIEDAERAQRQVQERFAGAYAALQEARATVGTERVRRMALSRAQAVELRLTPRSIMGVVVPTLSYPVPARQLLYSLADTGVALDQAQREWAEVLALIGPLAEKVTTVWRLALELRRTQRRVNALENIFIPAYEETLQYIQETLEEKDREDLFRMKRAKARLESNPQMDADEH